LLAMAKVVLQMIALRLEHIVVFVCDLPAPRPACATATTLLAVKR
jgi:hypothetical protein